MSSGGIHPLQREERGWWVAYSLEKAEVVNLDALGTEAQCALLASL